ncbi:MAG: class II fructose-bisphosphate aldolase [Candidatus Nomurabacteria bacterium]|nr:MAG: class II fructose-bisphosphate aldolase [Candidatus Nomurabacteria bacterium]HRV76088.1 class II fructose-bisphosphate aldolase [Candidatus Saccharimonadales bacterium]
MASIKEIRESTSKARQLLLRAHQQRFAVGAFNIDSQDILVAILRAAKELKAPVIINLSESEAEEIGLQNARDLVDNYKEEWGVEAYLNLDHGPSVKLAKEAIDLGFEFVHIDISQSDHGASLDEIIQKTKQVTEYARFTGAIVESEMHYFAGSSNLHDEDVDYEEVKKTFSDPKTSLEFVHNTDIDIFAASVGNLHGSYKVPKQLDLKLLESICNAVPCSVSLHGGSGTPLFYFEEAAKIGVSKININTDIRVAHRRALEEALKNHPDEYSVMKLMKSVEEATQKVVEEKIKAFGSAGKAV